MPLRCTQATSAASRDGLLGFPTLYSLSSAVTFPVSSLLISFINHYHIRPAFGQRCLHDIVSNGVQHSGVGPVQFAGRSLAWTLTLRRKKGKQGGARLRLRGGEGGEEGGGGTIFGHTRMHAIALMTRYQLLNNIAHFRTSLDNGHIRMHI